MPEKEGPAIADKNVADPEITFDILKSAPKGAAQLRAKALFTMREIVNNREPENIRFLNTHPGLSAEYAMYSAILNSKQPEVKADLTRVLVDENLAEGHRWVAVFTLAYARAAELPMPEYNNEWVAGQFDAALSERDPNGAWLIARKMVREGDKIVKREQDPEGTESKLSQEWVDREKRAFELHAEEVLAREVQPTGIWDDMDLRILFDEMKFRQDGGFNSGAPSGLSRRIAEKTIQKVLTIEGREWMALFDAVEAKMPDDYIIKLRTQVSPTVMDKTRKWFSGIRAKFDKFVYKE